MITGVRGGGRHHIGNERVQRKWIVAVGALILLAVVGFYTRAAPPRVITSVAGAAWPMWYVRALKCPFAFTADGTCAALPRVQEPAVTAVLLTWHTDRRQNLPRVLRRLLLHEWIDDIIIFNNNVDAPIYANDSVIKPYAHAVTVINSEANTRTRGRFIGCLAGRQDACLVLDDDWLPTGLDGLHASYASASDLGDGGVHVVTDAVTRETDRSQRFVLPDNTTAGFAWLGVGSIFSKHLAKRFLAQFDAIAAVDYDIAAMSGYEDIFFTLWHRRAFPVTLETAAVQLHGNTAEYAMSAASGYDDVEARGILLAVSALIRHARVFEDVDAALGMRDSGPHAANGIPKAAHALEPALFVTSADEPPPKRLPVPPEPLILNYDAGYTWRHDRRWSKTRVQLNPGRVFDGDVGTCWPARSVDAPGGFFGLMFGADVEVEALLVTLAVSATGYEQITYGCLDICAFDMYHNTTQCEPAVHSFSFTLSANRLAVYVPVPDELPRARAYVLRAPDEPRCSSSYMIGTDMAPVCDIRPVVKPSAAPTPVVRKPRVLIAVTTTAGAAGLRYAARSTWMRELRAHPDVGVFFALGPRSDMPKAVRDEADRYEDIHFFEREVTYSTLTNRTLDIWEYGLTTGADIIVKMNDDTYINLHRLMTELDAVRSAAKRVYFGYFNVGGPVIYNAMHKNHETFGVDDPDHMQVYRPYASGSCYAVGRDLAAAILQAPIWLRNEDCMTGHNVAELEMPGTLYLHTHNGHIHTPYSADARQVLFIHDVCPSHFYLLFAAWVREQQHVVTRKWNVCGSG